MMCKKRNRCLHLLILLVSNGMVAIAGSSTPRSLVVVSGLEDGKARIDYVKHKLPERLEYVKSGKRMLDFQDWVRERGGEPKIFSMHGVDVNFEIDELENLDLAINIVPVSSMQVRCNDPFLPDRMNLNFCNNTQKLFNQGDTKENDHKPPTPVQLTLRAAKLSIHFAPVLTTAWLALISKRFRCAVWYRWVATCLASSGAAFIKWGQWAATRTDMFPTPLCDALSDLHNDAPAHSWNFTQTQVESSLDIPPGSLFEVFKSFDQEPLASGSIAQVHRAELYNGEVVAAKVRHPRVAQLIDLDFRLMTILASACNWIPAMKWLRIKDSVAQFSHTMAAQAHLNVEAHHLEVLSHNFRSWDHVRFPQPFYASSSLILETFEKGRIVSGILDEYDTLAASMDNATQGCDLIPLDEAKFLVTTGVSLYLKMLLMDNLMHADLHPGNIMLYGFTGDRGNRGEKYQITLVDAGMVAQLTDEESSTFIGLLCCLGESDGEAAAEFALRFSIENNIDDSEKAIFKQEMKALFEKKCKGYGTNIDVGEVLRGILGLIRDHHIRIDANYATLVINVLCVESLGKRICPSYNVLDASRPLLQAYRKHVYESDGFTPKSKTSYTKRVKRVMPLMLYGTKTRADNAFFRNIETKRQRISAKVPIRRGGNGNSRDYEGKRR